MSHSTDGFRERIVRISIIVLIFFVFPRPGVHLAAQIVEEALPISSDRSQTKQMADGGIYWINGASINFTDDNGSTKTSVPLPPDVGSSMRMDWSGSGKGLLYYKSSLDTGLIALAWTDDNGQSWDVQRFKTLDRMKVPLVRRTFDAIERINDSTAYCAIDKTIYLSTDRGRTFSDLEFSSPVQVINMNFVGLYGWVWQNYSEDIAGTTDGGRSWTKYSLSGRVRAVNINGDGRSSIHCSGNAPSVFITEPFQTSLEIPQLPQGEGLSTLSAFDYMYVDEDHRWCFAKQSHAEKTDVFITTDGGGHWFRTEMNAVIGDALPIDATHALVLSPAWTRLTLTQDRPFTVSAVSSCSVEKLRVTLTWTDPSDGEFTHGVIERAAADSQWTSVGSVLPPDLYFTDETLLDTSTVRYRVTLSTPDGELRQVSDSVTPIPGEYVNFLEMLLPGEDWILRYEFKHTVTLYGQFVSDTTVIVEYRYLGAFDSTRWMRVHPFVVTEIALTGESSSRKELLIEHRGSIPHFSQVGRGSLSIFEYTENIECGEIGSFFESYSPHPVYFPAYILPHPHADSVQFWTAASPPSKSGSAQSTIRGIGITRKLSSGISVGNFLNSLSWTLIEHVNSSLQVRPSASGLRLSSYPNPFVSVATVSFAVAAAGPVRLSVHDMLGREVALLREGRVEPGSYSVPFSASGLPSGMYIARIQTGQEVTQRLLTCLR